MRTTKPLTSTQIKNAKTKQKEYNLADGGGLFLRVKPNSTMYVVKPSWTKLALI